MHGGKNYITVLGRYLAFALVFFSVTAFGDGFLDDDLDYSFEYGSATQVYVTGMSMYTSATNITIPATVVYEYLDSDENGNAHIKHRDCIVVRIGDSAFSDCSTLTGVVISNSVTRIGTEAFKRCGSLRSLTIGTNVVEIGASAFYACSNLTEELVLPRKLRLIGEKAFYGCGKLFGELIIPNGTKTVGTRAFFGCHGLSGAILPESLESVGEWSFDYCAGLKKVQIPSCVVTNSLGACKTFAYRQWRNYPSDIAPDLGNADVEELIVAEGVQFLTDKAFFDVGQGQGQLWPRLKKVTLPSTLRSIGEQVFSGCSELCGIDIPQAVTNIGRSAFYNCKSITHAEIPGAVESLNTVFYGCEALEDLELGNGIKNIKDFDRCVNLTRVTLPNTITNLGGFAYCTNLVEINIPDGVVNIEINTLRRTAIGEIAIPASVESIKPQSFWECGNLVSISVSDFNAFYSSYNGLLLSKDGTSLIKGVACDAVIPNTVKIIGDKAFYGLVRPTSVQMGNSVTNIGLEAFSGCIGLTGVIIGDSVPVIGNNAFAGCANLINLTIGKSVEHIGDGAFSGCRSLTNVTLPSGLTSIGNNVFSGCRSLKNIAIPDSVNRIGGYAFMECSSLTDVTMPDCVTSIGSMAFSCCDALMNVIMPDSVTIISSAMFSECTNLANVVIGNSVTNIQGFAFHNCSNLTSMIFRGDAPKNVAVGTYGAFQGLSSRCTAYVREDSVGWGVSIPGVWNGMRIEYYDSGESPPAQTVVRQGDYAWTCTLTPDNTAVIRAVATLPPDAYGVPHGALEIPSSLGGRPVSAIGDGVFADSLITSLYVPSSVKVIGAEAFKRCTNLVSATLAEGITNIGNAAFADCTSLTNMVIPNTVSQIGANAFLRCRSLVSITLPTSLRSLEPLFQQCESLTELVIPEGVTSVGNNVIAGCSALKRLVLPSTLGSAVDYAFAYAPALEEVVGLEHVKDGCYMSYGIFCGDASLKRIDLSRIDISGGVGMFSGCSNLGEVVLPTRGWEIGAGAFAGCSSLTNVVGTWRIRSIGEESFAGCSALPEITLYGWEARPPSPLAANDGFYPCCAIGENAFAFCEGLTNIVFKGVPIDTDEYGFVADSAFHGCTNAIGTYQAKFEDEWLAALGETGKWHGLAMQSGNDIYAGGDIYEIRAINPHDGTPTNAYTTADSPLGAGETLVFEIRLISREPISSPWCSPWRLEYVGAADAETAMWERPPQVGIWVSGQVKWADIYGVWSFTNNASVFTDILCGYRTQAGDLAMPIRLVTTDGKPADETSGIDASGEYLLDLGPEWRIVNDERESPNLWYWNETTGYHVSRPPDGNRVVDRTLETCGFFVQTPTEVDGVAWTYKIDDNGTATITGALWWENPNFVIPSTIGGCPVVRIGEGAEGLFRGSEACEYMRRILIPEGVLEIGDYAFEGCTGLSELSIPSSVTNIGRSAFMECTGITNLTINSERTFEGGCFAYCPSIESVTIGDNCRRIDDGFGQFGGFLRSVTIGKNVKTIGNEVFMYCDAMDVVIPDSVTDIGCNFMMNCHSLRTAWIGTGVTNIAFGCMADCENLSAVVFEGRRAPAIDPTSAFYCARRETNLFIYVAHGSTGWGVDIPGKWDGVHFAYDIAYHALMAYIDEDRMSTAGEAAAVADAISISNFADPDVTSAIGGNAEKYGKFKSWARSVPGGEAAVIANTNSAAAFLLGAERLFDNAPKIEMCDVAVRGQDLGSPSQGTGTSMAVDVTVKDGENFVACAAEKVKGMFEATSSLGDWYGTAKLEPTVTVEDADDYKRMRFTVVPGDGTATRAFLRVKVK